MTDAVLQHPLWPDAEPARNDMPLSAATSAAATRRNWIAVACAQHARRGCATPGAGYMQVCHGKVAPLQRIRPGDRVAYYAPTVTMGARTGCRRLSPSASCCRARRMRLIWAAGLCRRGGT